MALGLPHEWFYHKLVPEIVGLYIYICHYHYPHDISTYYDTYIYKYQYLNIYIYTHTPKQKQKKTCWTNLHNCCMVVSNHGAQWSNCLCGLHWMQGRIESHCHQSALRDHQRWPLGLSTAPANVQKLRWVCWMIFMGSMAFIPPKNGSGYTVLRCKKKLVTGYNFSYTKSYDKLWSETNINYFFTFL